MRPVKITQEQRNQVLGLHSKGQSLRSIAGVVKLSHMSVKQVIEASGHRTHERKVYADAMEPVINKIKKIELELSALNLAYKNDSITLKELCDKEEQLGNKYSRWIEIYEKNKNFHYHDNEIPISSLNNTRRTDGEFVDSLLENPRNLLVK